VNLPLTGVTVVECAERIAGPLAGLHLRLLGAEIRKVEPPGGDISRRWGGGEVFAVLNAGKDLVALDGDDGLLARELERANAAIVDEGPASALAREIAGRGNANLRSVAIVGRDAVPGGWGSTETTAQAGLAFTQYVGDPSGPPARIGADLAEATAGLQAAQAVLAGLLAGRNPSVATVSPARAAATMKTIHLAGRSDPAEWEGYHVTGGDRLPDQGYRAGDGRMSFEFPPNMGDAWAEFCRTLGLDDLVDEVGDGWYSTVGMEERADRARPRYERGLSAVTRAEAVDLVRRLGGWAVPFQTPKEVGEHAQTRMYGAVRLSGAEVEICAPWKLAQVDEVVLAPRSSTSVEDGGHVGGGTQ
jgi:crotonobetainyl-CoA:carnitine CoA-transferase CaiB-like acyl-CoA transferase